MPNTIAITATGNHVPFDILWYTIHDLLEFNHISVEDHDELAYWIWEYEHGGAMPSGKKFLSPYSGAKIPFTWVLDDLYLLFVMADDADMSFRDPEEPIPMDLINQYLQLPVNIGRWAYFQPHLNRIAYELDEI